MKTRIIGGILAVVLAVAGALVIMAYVRGADQRALAGARTVDVLVVSELIVAGTAAAEVEGLPVIDDRPPEEILGYDERGLPS